MTETSLPRGWRTVHLSDFGRLIRGRGITRADLVAAGVPCLRYGEIYTKYQDTIDDLQSYVSEAAASTATPLAHGDIIFAASGETREEIGKAVAWLGYGRAVSGGDTVLLRDHGQDPTFLVHALNSDDAARQKSTRGKGDAVVHLHAPDLAEITVVLPPLSEQRRIAAMLRTWDQAIEAISSLQEAATRQRQGLIQALLKSPQGNRTHRLQPVRSGHSAE
ncbi:MAG: restriction endonuclease subunit S [Gemmatimonadota bacterium]|nr:restriction endonuclease subunit S [Gemmatimonadota bacterium]